MALRRVKIGRLYKFVLNTEAVSKKAGSIGEEWGKGLRKACVTDFWRLEG